MHIPLAALRAMCDVLVSVAYLPARCEGWEGLPIRDARVTSHASCPLPAENLTLRGVMDMRCGKGNCSVEPSKFLETKTLTAKSAA